MKKVMFIAALMMAVLPTEAQQVKYTINGISKDNGKTVSLIDRKTNQTVNTATVVDGKFTMNGNAEKDAFMAIGIKENPWATIFFNDGTPMTINLNDSTLKGSPLNERLVRYDIDINAPYANYMIKIQSMSEEERKAKEMELAGGLMIAMMKMMTGIQGGARDARPRRLHQRVSADVRSAETRQCPRHQTSLGQPSHRKKPGGSCGPAEGSGGKETCFYWQAVHRPRGG